MTNEAIINPDTVRAEAIRIIRHQPAISAASLYDAVRSVVPDSIRLSAGDASALVSVCDRALATFGDESPTEPPSHCQVCGDTLAESLVVQTSGREYDTHADCVDA